MEIAAIFRTLRKHILVILMTAIVAESAVVFFYMNTGQLFRYSATATVLIGGDVLRTDQDRTYLELAEELAPTYVQLAQMSYTARTVVESLGLTISPHVLTSAISARLIPNTQLIEITINHSNANEAVTLANEVARSLVNQSPPQLPNFITLVNEAVLPRGPNIGPFLSIAIAGLAGLIAGAGIVIVVQLSQGRVDSIATLRSQIDLPILGTIPKIGRFGWSWLRRIFGRNNLRTHWSAQHLPLWERIIELYIHPARLNTATTGSQTNNIRENGPVFSRANTGNSTSNRTSKIIGITSCGFLEGKSTTALNIATSYAQRGKKVILVDASFHRPVLHRVLQEPNERGLFTLLRGREKRTLDFLKKSILSTQIEGLAFLPSGINGGTHPYSFDPIRLREIFTRLVSLCDVVIVDCLPLLETSSGVGLIRQLDEAIFVMRMDVTPLASLSELTDTMNKVNTKIIGMVVNQG